jgi:RNA polymerase-binding transcription factor DksA
MSTATMSLKERLQLELDEAQAELARLEERLEGKGDYGLGKGDPSIYEWEMCLALKQRAQGKVKSLQTALRLADEGDYGPARLAILPETRRCITCAQKR